MISQVLKIVQRLGRGVTSDAVNGLRRLFLFDLGPTIAQWDSQVKYQVIRL